MRTLISIPALVGLVALSTPLSAQECSVELAQIATLGRIGDSISVQVPSNVSVARVPWGGWLVAEFEGSVLRYRRDGSFQGPFVRGGQGPGELRSPSTVVVDATDSTWISDYHGRALVYDPSGVLARTVTNPGMDFVHGFTPSGHPFTVGVAIVGGTLEAPKVDPYIRVVNRMGYEVGMYRPGPASDQNYPLQLAPRIHAINDSTFRYAAEQERVVQTWSNGSVASRFELAEVGHAVGIAPLSPEDIRSMGVFPDGDGGTWLAVRVRRLSEDEEARLVEAAPSVPGYHRSVTTVLAFSPPVANSVWDGLFVHLSDQGAVTAVGTSEEYPFGFSGPREFYSFTETDVGLAQIHIWEFERACR